MELYIERMTNEHAELTERIVKLTDFIVMDERYDTLPGIEQGLLGAQLSAMQAYAAVLQMRLDRVLPPTPATPR